MRCDHAAKVGGGNQMMSNETSLLYGGGRAAANVSASPVVADDEGGFTEEPQRPRVSVVIPALNEARNLPHVFSTLPPDLYEIVLVDGGSTDETVQVARDLYPDVLIVGQKGRGKGDALAAGFAAARGDIILVSPD
jgi:cellulose synthase/poly-beta-1,6-N-acetylglucosamine synthase-like glycosyltransferase